MNKAVAPVEPKKVVSVEILHLDELGYGPQGKHTRREWRAECLESFLGDKKKFETWQNICKVTIHPVIGNVSFECQIKYEDGLIESVLKSANFEPYSLDFSGHIFEKKINADYVVFKLPVLFHGTIFTKYASFDRSQFEAPVNFRKTFFRGNSYFESAKFCKASIFGEAIFSGNANFSNVHFLGNANFTNARFYLNANFIKTKFENESRFLGSGANKTEFYGSVNFENAEILNVGHFERVRFNGQIPNFLGVDNSKTLLIFSGDEYFNKKDFSDNAINSLAQLKRLAEEQSQTDQVLMFNSLELNAKRAQARDITMHLTWWQKINNDDYWFANATAGFRIFSDYGRSFFEPLKWYFALLGITFYLAIAHAVYFTNKECQNEYANVFSYLWRDQIQCAPVKPKDNETPIVLSGWRAAVEYTSYRASGILDFADSDKQTIAISNRLFNQPIEPPWMRAWGIFKGIASIALLFLAALGLRNKYRIK